MTGPIKIKKILIVEDNPDNRELLAKVLNSTPHVVVEAKDGREALELFRAENPHELMRCLEVMSIIDNAGMVLHASLERRESRRAPFGFYRADFPEQDDKEWLAFLALKQSEGTIQFSRIPIKK